MKFECSNCDRTEAPPVSSGRCELCEVSTELPDKTIIKGLEVPLEEYFRYHPPQSKERIAKHDAINKAALGFAKATLKPAGFSESMAIDNAEYWFDRCCATALEVCSSGWLQENALNEFSCALAEMEDAGPSRVIFSHIQQGRMFVNQAITIEEIISGQKA